MNLQINETENYLLFFLPTKGYSRIQNVLQTKTKVQLTTGVEKKHAQDTACITLRNSPALMENSCGI